MPLLLALLAGCGPRQVVTWDRVSTGDAIEDIAVAMLLFGKVEGDRADLRGPHLQGGSLVVDVVGSGIAPRESDGWRVAPLAPGVVDVVSQTPSGERLRVELAFVGEGETDLFVIDEQQAILDVQHIHVERPAGVQLQAWDDLSAGTERVLDEPIHLLAGSDADIAVRWTDTRGTPLTGAGLLTHEASEPPGVDVSSRSTGQTDLLELDAIPTASATTFSVDLLADGERIVDVDVEVVSRDDVDELHTTVEVHGADDSGQRGAVLAELFREGDRLVGAEVDWLDADGQLLGRGALVTWGGAPGEQSEVTACHDTSLCETVPIAGFPIAVGDGDAPSPFFGEPLSCSCDMGAGPGGVWPGALLGLLLVGRRQGRRRSSMPRISSSRRR